MLTSQDVKTFGTESLQEDKVGVANIERFDGAPPEMDPRNIMPTARSVIVMIRRILRGGYRGIDEGTHWPSYTVFGYAGINWAHDKANYRLARFIEDHGYEAVPILGVATLREWGPRGPSPRAGMPRREVSLHNRIAATLAGLGEIGWSKVFLTEEFGPRQRIVCLLTDAPLEPDPIRVGQICDRCMRCVRECPAHAISADQAVTANLAGHQVEWGDLNLGRCKLTHGGLTRASAPHLIQRYPGLDMPIDSQSVTWREALDVTWTLASSIPTYQALASAGHTYAICGARGCIIGCMKHLEKRGKVRNRFVEKPVFSEGPVWSLPARPAPATHHGFIYDPDADDRKQESTAGHGAMIGGSRDSTMTTMPA